MKHLRQSVQDFSRFTLKPVLRVTLREILITVRYPTWFVASFFWPFIFPLSFFFVGRGLAGTDGQGLESFSRLAETGDYASFLILGNLIWMFVNINLWMGGLSLQQDRVRGAFDTHWCLPVSKVSLVIGSTIASLLLNFVPMIVSILIYSAMGALRVSGNLADILAAVLLVMPFLIGFLFTFAALTLRLRQASLVVMVIRTILSILCGMQFPLAVLPESVSRIGRYIPLTHFVDLIRGIIINRLPVSAFGASITYLTLSGIVMLLLGLGVFELTKRSIRKHGLSAGY